jgi:hypothetical protein
MPDCGVHILRHILGQRSSSHKRKQ